VVLPSYGKETIQNFIKSPLITELDEWIEKDDLSEADMKVMWESLMLRNLLWANFKETCDPPKFSMQDLHKLFLRLRKEKELYESSSAFGEALPTLII
jgi:hypothetical protein